MAAESPVHSSTRTDSPEPSTEILTTATPSSFHLSNDIPAPADGSSHTPLSISQPIDKASKDQANSSAESTVDHLLVAENAKSKLLPIPVATISHGNSSQTSFVIPGTVDGVGCLESENLPPDVAKADLSIAIDGSFVQTSSALAARELKKCYDKILRVGHGGQDGLVRSPYAITATQDESGAPVFRISHRAAPDTPTNDISPPEAPPSLFVPGHASGTRRKARLSVHDFLSSSIFKPSIDLPRKTPSMALGSGSTPPANMVTTSISQPRRKLRKTRSNSDMYFRTTNASHGSSTDGDASGQTSPPPRSESFSIEIRDEVTAGADAFSQILGWSSDLAMDSKSFTRKSSVLFLPEGARDLPGSLGAASTSDTHLSRRSSVSTSTALSGTTGDNSNAPFGDNVRYTAPLRRSAILPVLDPPQLREMQSFESGLTAKVGDARAVTPGTPKSKANAFDEQGDVPFLIVRSQTRFSTVVFDVFQNYTGLPLPSALLSAPPTGATIKLSTTDSANPKDDPRFVIWGEIQPEGALVDNASLSHSQSSHADLSNSSLPPALGTGLRKRSNARSPHSLGDTPHLVVSPKNDPQTVMIAATVERWIAQLTSELNYEELLNFLLTYRTYISPVDLCHLLICRFHWALETPSSKQDEMVRGIVRVRTFIAIRYWLLTFFREDFLPNAELCRLFASWLNTLFRDPALKKHPDAFNIVRKLKRVVRECKTAHSRHGRSSVERPRMQPRAPRYGAAGDLSDATHATNRKDDADMEHDDRDVDLEFSLPARSQYTVALNGDEPKDSPLPPGNSLLVQPTIAIPPARSVATPSANTILLSQPLSTTILGHVRSAKPGTDTTLTQIQSALPAQHGPISRAFVNTIGRLGRWKRVLNARSSVSAPHCGNMSMFDLEPNATGDLLAVRGGVEEYLKMLNLSSVVIPKDQPQENNDASGNNSFQPILPPGLISLVEEGKDDNPTVQPNARDEATEDEEVIPTSHESRGTESEAATEKSEPFNSEISSPLDWTPEIVSLDDYDLSDSDSSSRPAPKLRRLPRRLPLRKDFQFVRHSTESVSSMGIRSQSSAASSMKSESASGSIRSHLSTSSEVREVVTGHFQQWQIELISDDEEEAGDAEAALRRLEGQIDLDRQREKDMKVGRWLKNASRRMHRDSVSSINTGSQFSESEGERDEEEGDAPDTPDNEDVTVSVTSRGTPSTANTLLVQDINIQRTTVMREPTPPAVTVPAPAEVASNRNHSESLGSIQVPVQSRPVSPPLSSAGGNRRPSILGRTPRVPAPSKHGPTSSFPPHRSFILMHRSQTLAQQFAIIDAELFAKIKFEELISHQWGQSLEDVNVRDWVQFIKERAKLKNTGKSTVDQAASDKLSAILALRARFDLLVNFVSSEVLLTHPNERVILLRKILRVAWKAYLHNNFGTLVALITGLQTRWVNQAIGRHWHKLGLWEQRIFQGLKAFTSRAGEFRCIRDATAKLIDAHPLKTGPQDNVSTSGPIGNVSSTSSKGKATEMRDSLSACVPFLGVYLAQLYEYEKLPDFIDPTTPAEPVLIDGETGALGPPSHPEVFFNLQPLPRDLTLEPLINVHKQRLIAGVIKSLVAGQHLATNIPFEVDLKCYQKCFRLRSLDTEALHVLAKSSLNSQG
ncbi:ras GEF [Ramaria rubella]|nr:ras GEF [Ramaria rubella]